MLFVFSYFRVRNYYIRQIRKCLYEARELVRQFFDRYKERAKEFESNLNAAVKHYCIVYNNNREAARRFRLTDFEKRKKWHSIKIKDILNNLSYFDTFVRDVYPVRENDFPTLTDLNDDAAHSDFYQMKIFR